MTERIKGRLWSSRELVEISIEGNRIEAIIPVRELSDTGLWIAPPLFDLQINGFAGVDFQNPDISQDDLIESVKSLHRNGCLKFFLTLITDEWERLILKLRKFKRFRDGNEFLRNSIAGWHIEGPFLSDKPGFCGAHNPIKMIDPTPDRIFQLRDVIGDDKILLTLAPERDGALDAIELATKLGITVFLGHTDASYETLKRAIQNGAKGFTHLGNGCPQSLDRKDNIIWRVLNIEGFTVTLIPDKIHVSPLLFKLIHKVKNLNEIIYVSDAISAAGSPPGRYTLGEIEIRVEDDGIAWNPSKTGYAGSSLKPFEGILRASEMLDEDWQKTWARYSIFPSHLIGVNLDLLPGAEANFVVLKHKKDKKLEIESIFFMGEQIYP